MDVDRPQGLGGPSVHGYRIRVSHIGPSSFAWSNDSNPGLSCLNASTGQKSEVKGQEARNLGPISSLSPLFSQGFFSCDFQGFLSLPFFFRWLLSACFQMVSTVISVQLIPEEPPP